MQVLKGQMGTIAACALLAGLSGCERASPDYARISEIPQSEWNAFAGRLPLDRRLDLHIEIMERSGPNPSTTISQSFNDDAEKTYELIVERVKSGADSRYYIPVLYEINRNDKFKICEQKDRKIVQEYLWKYATDAVSPEERSDFYRC